MIGQTVFVGSQNYLVVNDQGTLERLAPMPWYRELFLYIRTRFSPMTIAEIRDYVRLHQRGGTI